MYREAAEAAEAINHGLSLGARLLLGVFATLFGIVMMLIAPPTIKRVRFIFLIFPSRGRPADRRGMLRGTSPSHAASLNSSAASVVSAADFVLHTFAAGACTA